MQSGLWEEKLGNCCRGFFVAGVCNNPKLNVPCTCYWQQYFRMRHFTVYSFVGEGKQLEMSSHSRFPHLHFGALSTSLSLKSLRSHITQARATQGLSLTVEKSQRGKPTPKHWRVLTLTFFYTPLTTTKLAVLVGTVTAPSSRLWTKSPHECKGSMQKFLSCPISLRHYVKHSLRGNETFSKRLSLYTQSWAWHAWGARDPQKAALGWVAPQALSKAACLKWKNPGQSDTLTRLEEAGVWQCGWVDFCC